MSQQVPALVVVDDGVDPARVPLSGLDQVQVVLGLPGDDTSFTRRPSVVIVVGADAGTVRDLARGCRARLAGVPILGMTEPSAEAQLWVEVGVTIDAFELLDAAPGRLAARVFGLSQLASRENRSDLLVKNIRMMAHDVNNPLTVVRILADVLGGEDLSEEAQQDLSDILEATDTAGRLVDGMSAWAKLVNGQDAIENRSPVDLGGLVRRVASQPAFARGLVLRHVDVGIEVLASQRELERAVSDLFVNAKRLAAPGRGVAVSLVRDGDSASLNMVPDGLTMHPDLRRYLGDAYGQVHLRDLKLPTACFGLAGPRIVAERLGGSLTFQDGTEGPALVCTVRLNPDG